MEVFVYLLLGVLAYVIGYFAIYFRAGLKLLNYFRENPDSLPKELPDHIKEAKDFFGEDFFNEFYERFQKGEFDE